MKQIYLNTRRGHRRLAIVDPNSREADMPFQLNLGGERKISLVANGEIYNHKELYEKLRTQHGWADQVRGLPSQLSRAFSS